MSYCNNKKKQFISFSHLYFWRKYKWGWGPLGWEIRSARARLGLGRGLQANQNGPFGFWACKSNRWVGPILSPTIVKIRTNQKLAQLCFFFLFIWKSLLWIYSVACFCRRTIETRVECLFHLIISKYCTKFLFPWLRLYVYLVYDLTWTGFVL